MRFAEPNDPQTSPVAHRPDRSAFPHIVAAILSGRCWIHPNGELAGIHADGGLVYLGNTNHAATLPALDRELAEHPVEDYLVDPAMTVARAGQAAEGWAR
jgi:hypothetical protein